MSVPRGTVELMIDVLDVALRYDAQLRYCPDCRDDRACEQPPCAEHDECPEWICLDCGAATVTGWLSVDEPVTAIAVTHAA